MFFSQIALQYWKYSRINVENGICNRFFTQCSFSFRYFHFYPMDLIILLNVDCKSYESFQNKPVKIQQVGAAKASSFLLRLHQTKPRSCHQRLMVFCSYPRKDWRAWNRASLSCRAWTPLPHRRWRQRNRGAAERTDPWARTPASAHAHPALPGAPTDGGELLLHCKAVFSSLTSRVCTGRGLLFSSGNGENLGNAGGLFPLTAGHLSQLLCFLVTRHNFEEQVQIIFQNKFPFKCSCFYVNDKSSIQMDDVWSGSRLWAFNKKNRFLFS